MKTKIAIVLAAVLTALLSVDVLAEEIHTATCVESIDFKGVVVSKIITPRNTDKGKWCFIYTATGLETTDIKDLKAIPCYDFVDKFPEERRQVLWDWLEGGINPMLLDN